MTATSANHLSNIAKENYMAIERQMAKLEFYRTAVGLIGGSEETVVSCGTGPERFSRIRKWVEEVCACKSLIAYLREAIKAKDKLTRDLDDYGADEIRDLWEVLSDTRTAGTLHGGRGSFWTCVLEILASGSQAAESIKAFVLSALHFRLPKE